MNPFEIYVDNKRIEENYVHTKGGVLVAKVSPKHKWNKIFNEQFEGKVNLFLFETDKFQYKNLEKMIREPILIFEDLEGQTLVKQILGKQIVKEKYQVTKMGKIPTLKGYDTKEISTNLKPGFLYDLIAIKQPIGGDRVFAGMRRLSTQEGEVPKDMTLHELKLLACEYLDLSPEETQGLKAKIIIMNDLDKERNIRHYTGFDFNENPETPYGIYVRQDGVIKAYPDDSKFIIRELLKI
jgi:hypothetical protein